jgi:hypothetical protein
MVRAGRQGRRRPNFDFLIVLSRGGCQKSSPPRATEARSTWRRILVAVSRTDTLEKPALVMGALSRGRIAELIIGTTAADVHRRALETGAAHGTAPPNLGGSGSSFNTDLGAQLPPKPPERQLPMAASA